jgi:hypothetical protein
MSNAKSNATGSSYKRIGMQCCFGMLAHGVQRVASNSIHVAHACTSSTIPWISKNFRLYDTRSYYLNITVRIF